MQINLTGALFCVPVYIFNKLSITHYNVRGWFLMCSYVKGIKRSLRGLSV